MKLQIYVAFVKDGKGIPHAGVLIATDPVNAMSRAIQRCKTEYGKRSRVTMIKHVADADLPTMQRTQLLQTLLDVDKVAFCSVELEKIMQQSAELLQNLMTYVQTLKTKLAGE